jgi:hypothetical protein
MIVILRLFTIAGILTTARKEPFMLLLTYLKPFGAPQAVNPFEVYRPAFLSELYGYPAIAVSWMPDMQSQQIFGYRLVLISQPGLIPLGTSALT